VCVEKLLVVTRVNLQREPTPELCVEVISNSNLSATARSGCKPSATARPRKTFRCNDAVDAAPERFNVGTSQRFPPATSMAARAREMNRRRRSVLAYAFVAVSSRSAR